MTDTTAIVSASLDPDLRHRIAAVVATEDFNAPGEHPTTWADKYQWDVCAEPGIGDAYASALAAGNPRPGWDLAVITDGALLAAVTAVAQGNTPVEAALTLGQVTDAVLERLVALLEGDDDPVTALRQNLGG